MKYKKSKKALYFAFRILIGLGFFLHGYSKLFGAKAVPLISLLGLAGIIELFGGVLIIMGLFTTMASIFGAATMLGAWIKVHLPQGINPLSNGGEASMLYFAAMLVLITFGSGSYSLEKFLFKKEFCHKDK